MGIHPTLKLDETEGFGCLGHSNWTICSPMSPFSSKRFSTFSLSYWEANSYYPRGPIMEKGNSCNFKIGWDRGLSVPGAFKLDHLQPFEPILSQKIFNFFTFILGGQFLLPQRANNGKWGFIQLHNWMRQGVFSAWGIQTGPFAALWANSYYPRGLIMRKGKSSKSKSGWDRWVSVPGAFKLDHLQPVEPLLSR